MAQGLHPPPSPHGRLDPARGAGPACHWMPGDIATPNRRFPQIISLPDLTQDLRQYLPPEDLLLGY
eukprot:3916563-Prorocentrum_lima.AAC.1